ncbi:MAG: alpha/beta fold hydrolase [Frankiales bacterium]|jgi:pimeloyl-ACP methyl ester carboxylesterase|nr:alpha/beta fold hydrolase [Frankiales bacterium]
MDSSATPGGHRRTLLLIPGLICDEDLYREQAAALGDEVDVVISDVSQGRSMAELARAALEVAPERFALAGLSMGGYVAWEVLRQAPERVTALALMDTSARPEVDEQTSRRQALIELTQAGRFADVLDLLWPSEVSPGRRSDAALRARADAMFLRAGPEVFVRHQLAIIARVDSRPDLANVDVPALVLCGRDDAITPLDGSEEMAAGIPGAELVVLDDCGHLSTWERPDEVTDALRAWLAR